MITRAKARSESQLAQKSKASQVDLPNSSVKPKDNNKQCPRSSRSSVESASCANKSVVSNVLRRRLELEAAEEKARLLVEEAKVKAQMELVDKRLNAGLAEIEERRSCGSSVSSARRTEKWVAQQNVNLRRIPATHNARHSDTPAAVGQDVFQSDLATHGDVLFSVPNSHNMSEPFVATVAQGHSQDQAILKLADAVHNLALGCATNNMLAVASSNEKIISRMTTPKELPIFRGDPLDWINFKSFYEESTQVCQFSNAENVCRLRKSLQGEAKECVAALLMGQVSAEIIMKTLELRFGRPEIIISKIVSQIRKIPSLPVSYHSDIVTFSIKIKNFVVAVKTIKQDDYLRSPELTSVILSKLPCTLITRWADYAHDHRDNSFNMTRIELLSEFLDLEAQKISDIGISLIQTTTAYRKTEVIHPHSSLQRPHVVLAQTKESLLNATNNESAKCRFCHKRTDHVIVDCPKFKRALRKDRWSFVRSNRLCPKCLASEHDKNTCEAPVCDIDNCGLPHHVILHWPIKYASANVTINEQPSEEEEQDEREVNDTMTDIAAEREVNDIVTDIAATTYAPMPSHVLLKYVRVRIHGPNNDVVTDALLDDGSTITMIDSKVAEQAGLRGRTESLRVRGAWDNSVLVCQTELLHFEISGDNCSRFNAVARTAEGISLPSQFYQPDHYNHLQVIQNSLCSDEMKPSMIIGQDNYHLLAPLEIMEGDPNATRTVLGWSVHGKSTEERRPHGFTHASTMFLSCHHDVESSWDELNDIIRRSYALDVLGVSAKPRQCSEDVRALKILDETSKQVGDHWEVGLPWKHNSVKMKDSYPTAYMRLQGVEKKMRMNSDFQARYRERVQHLLENNYAHICDEYDVAEPDHLWYLPHFGVDNPNKNKLRLVFDAAAKSQGYSLNDYLLQGPDLLVSLLGVLIRFREHSVAVTADIKDMFLRVHVRKEDQNALRFLWRDDVNESKISATYKARGKPPTTYVMNSLIFGACCSPFVAQYVKNKNAMLYEKEKPRAVKSIVKNHYVDDLMDSIETENAAVQLVQDVRNIHSKGGFKIRNWTSNSKTVLANLSEEDLGPSAVKFNIEGTSEGDRTLGLYWFPADDVLGFDVSLKRNSQNVLKGLKRPTKREMLSVIMSVFDILGFLAPMSIKSRILLQDVWRSGLAWDQEIKAKEFAKWRKWLESVEKLKTLRIPRWYLKAASPIQPGVVIRRELHIFCDASPQAYAAAAYWRILDGSNICVALIASKSRVAPLRPVSVPRLELQGAVLACRLAATIEKEHTVKPDQRFFWTDSSTVLLWIISDARNYKPFVANRLGEIDELTKFEEWRYVPTAMNVADFATKENVEDLQYDHPWFHGPDFLSREEIVWPENKFTNTSIDVDPELKKETVISAVTSAESISIPDPTRFSSWTRLLRATCTILVAIEKFRKVDAIVDSIKLNRAEILLLKQSQLESFPEDIAFLKQNKPLLRKSRLLKLSPYLDVDGVLRIQGRIDVAENIHIDAKRPAILDGRHHVSRLIVKYFHTSFAHANNETVINELRQRFWIIHLRPTVRYIASKCLVCRIRKAMPVAPRQGDLPSGRVAHHCRPSSHCGLDLFGPYDVTIGRRREKRYGVIFTCMTVRAIHLEIVHSLSTDGLLMALRRMAARRGWPTDLYSDNGTNLRGAYAELKNLQTETSNYRVNWHFNPPAASQSAYGWCLGEAHSQCENDIKSYYERKIAPR